MIGFVANTEEDEEWEERLRVLEDARKLKQVAEYFLHPEEPVPASLGSRCFFDRPSASGLITKEEADELAAILEDASALKNLATYYLHPEIPVVTTDAEACGRNFFTRYSALEQETPDEAQERAAIIADLKALKQLAEDFMHPENPLVGAATSARNYFTRASAPEYETVEEAAERALILQEAADFKKFAAGFMHPEIPVVVTDATACGRNYFTRASAPEYETEEAEVRAQILQDAAALKKSASDYLHPETSVVATDSTAFGRNYFNRASAPEYEEDAEEREQIMQDLKALKRVAMDYLHPEIGVVATDPTACGRNYFARYSAPEQITLEEAEARALVMADVAALKKSAVTFMHPELPVFTTDTTIFARNYFSRASAPELESVEDAEVRAQILEDAMAFKQLATEYMHPELPVVIYATATGRNYFARVSGPDYESLDDAEARAQVMEDLKAFKKVAVDFLHPELPVASADATAYGRNFFTRGSAYEQESVEDADELAAIMDEIKALKLNAVDYLHPHLPFVVYATATGRNFFSRPSAPEQESMDEAEERAAIMADVKAMKQAAIDYLHPELRVVGAAACARDFYSRPSAYEQETVEVVEERAAVMEDLKALKQAAVDYLHPELKVVGSAACVRNYFTRPSGLEQETAEEEEERTATMADLHALKQSAVYYLHPELPVATTDSAASGRNFFSRFSSPECETLEEAEERVQIMAETKALKQAATDYLHPEISVVTTDSTLCGRNYFDRPSSSSHYHMIHTFPPHEEDWTDHHHEHIDHFGMDEEMEIFADFREDMAAPIEQNRSKFVTGSDVGSNLSRSPSSVMLFGMDDSTYE